MRSAAVVAVLVAFVVLLVRTSWVAEDAYIGLRTVDNVLHGYGLTWNTDERVQTFTNPLWIMLLTGVVAVTGETFYSSIAVSVTLSVAAVVLLVRRNAVSRGSSILAILIFCGSKAFMDFSACGLENPLTHLLLVLFYGTYFSPEKPGRGGMRHFLLALYAACSVLCHHDALFLALPPLILSFWQRRSWRTCGQVLLGFGPLIAWELFSLWYYGFPLPNTVYAKLKTGVAGLDLVRQGVWYLRNSAWFDPVTLPVITCAVVLGIASKRPKHIAVSAALVLNLLWIVRVGGDFMTGRFLSGALLVAVVLIARFRFPNYACLGLAGAAVCGLCLLSPYPTVLTTADYGNHGRRQDLLCLPARESHPELPGDHGISDERGYFYWGAGLLPALQSQASYPSHNWAGKGRELRQHADRLPGVRLLVVVPCVGMSGYFGGPRVHIVDPLGVGDPLLARISLRRRIPWRIGHFGRTIPEGYLETIAKDRTLIRDPNLARYYDKLTVATRGSLASGRRLLEIIRLNLGCYDDLLDAYNRAEVEK